LKPRDLSGIGFLASKGRQNAKAHDLDLPKKEPEIVGIQLKPRDLDLPKKEPEFVGICSHASLII